jgi:predicted enzyme related to lactoylglutathione lyase
MNVAAVRIKGIDLSGYMVKDAARAIAFYRDVFGLEPSRIYPENRGAEYDLPDGTTFGLACLKDSPWHMNGSIEFAVPDVDAALKRAVDAGATLNEDLELPSCRMAWIQDTEGNSLCLHRRK